MTVEFTPWPKISRLFRDCVISEKIDGTNAAIGIVRGEGNWPQNMLSPSKFIPCDSEEGSHYYEVYAQSRSRVITPKDDNFGFARWVHDNAAELVATLGEGLHFGEWWGSGIQRGYGLPKGEKRFSLFNTPRYSEFDLTGVPSLGTVPIMYKGPFETREVTLAVEWLREHGSLAAPGFMKPEGVVTFHVAANTAFKTTLEKDEAPKGLLQHA